MLRWLQPKLPEKYVFLIKLFACSSVLHGFICFGLFFLYSSVGTTALVEINSQSAQAVVRVISFNKPKQSSKPGLGGKKSQTDQLAKKVQKTGQQGAQRKIKTALKKAALQKKVHKQSAKKIEKKVDKKIAQPVKPIKTEPKVIEKKREEPEKIIDNVTQPVLVKDVLPQDVIAAHAESSPEIEYLTPKEYEQVLIQDALKEALMLVWTPPAGMSQDLSCQVVITVGFDGVILATEIEQKSGVLIYDMAVEQAMAQVVMPRVLWGKKIKIVFKP